MGLVLLMAAHDTLVLTELAQFWILVVWSQCVAITGKPWACEAAGQTYQLFSESLVDRLFAAQEVRAKCSVVGVLAVGVMDR